MNTRFKTILLIDDDAATNFIHKTVIKRAKITENIVCVDGGQKALDYLTTESDGVYPQPELIFIDINMPGMNGWEFIEEYRKLPESQKGGITVVMLTASANPDDEVRARELGIINDFKIKPLSQEMLEGILAANFN